jgi:hypothetical protein
MSLALLADGVVNEDTLSDLTDLIELLDVHSTVDAYKSVVNRSNAVKDEALKYYEQKGIVEPVQTNKHCCKTLDILAEALVQNPNLLGAMSSNSYA